MTFGHSLFYISIILLLMLNKKLCYKNHYSYFISLYFLLLSKIFGLENVLPDWCSSCNSRKHLDCDMAWLSDYFATFCDSFRSTFKIKLCNIKKVLLSNLNPCIKCAHQLIVVVKELLIIDRWWSTNTTLYQQLYTNKPC